MNVDEGFIDLRLNRQEGQINESFWPSFTDIMTVIVMIFLIAMVVLLMRNIELVKELRTTMEAERVASELARATGEEKQSLSARLLESQEQVSSLRLQLMKLRELGLAQEGEIAEQLTQIVDLTGERDRLAREKAIVEMIRQRVETDLESAQVKLGRSEQKNVNLETNLIGLERNLQNLQTRFKGAQDSIATLQETMTEQQLALDQVRSERTEYDRKYLVLAGEYDDLKVRYDKLVKPARSAKGRRLVEVRYWKAGEKFRIAYRLDGSGPFESTNRSDLDQRLTAIRDSEQNGLYVKVIFPENSGLSYNEAWGFTTHLHRNFDYYYQEEEQETQPNGANDKIDTSDGPEQSKTEQ